MLIHFALLLPLALPAAAQTDAVARAEIEHLRELIAANDRLYFQQFEAMRQTNALALTAAKEATVKAETATEKRLEGVNEFRGQLKDQAANFVTRSELWGYFIGSVGVILAFISVIRRVRWTSGGKRKG